MAFGSVGDEKITVTVILIMLRLLLTMANDESNNRYNYHGNFTSVITVVFITKVVKILVLLFYESY